jgi:glutathione S-transferase
MLLDRGGTRPEEATMPYVHIVVALALLEFLYFALQVSWARGRYHVAAPATTGHESFERYFRVHMNTLELLVIFIPSILMFSVYQSPHVAAEIGAVYVFGRLVYLLSYVKDPKTRALGFVLSVTPIIVLLVGAIVGAVRALLLQDGLHV